MRTKTIEPPTTPVLDRLCDELHRLAETEERVPPHMLTYAAAVIGALDAERRGISAQAG